MPRSAVGLVEPQNVRPWDRGGDRVVGDSDSDVDEELEELRRADEMFYNECTAEEAGAEFCNLLVEMKRSSQKMTAQAACQLAFWATRGGIQGPAHLLAMKPQRQSGKYAPKFDRFVNAETNPTDGSFYRLRGISVFPGGSHRISAPICPSYQPTRL